MLFSKNEIFKHIGLVSQTMAYIKPGLDFSSVRTFKWTCLGNKTLVILRHWHNLRYISASFFQLRVLTLIKCSVILWCWKCKKVHCEIFKLPSKVFYSFLWRRKLKQDNFTLG